MALTFRAIMLFLACMVLGVVAARCEEGRPQRYLPAPIIVDDGVRDVESLSNYRPCCGRCAYNRGCIDDPRDRGACCDEHGVPSEYRKGKAR